MQGGLLSAVKNEAAKRDAMKHDNAILGEVKEPSWENAKPK
jgi:hypothetical protein